MQILAQDGLDLGAEVAHAPVAERDVGQRVAPAQGAPQGVRTHRLAGAADQAETAAQPPFVNGRGDAAPLVRGGVLGMRRPDVAVGAAVDFDQAVEHRVAGKTAVRQVLDIDVVLPVGFAVAKSESGRDDGQVRATGQRIVRGVQPPVKGVEFE